MTRTTKRQGFNSLAFVGIRNHAGLNGFNISEGMNQTTGLGLLAKSAERQYESLIAQEEDQKKLESGKDKLPRKGSA